MKIFSKLCTKTIRYNAFNNLSSHTNDLGWWLNLRDPYKASVFDHRLFLKSLQHLKLKVPAWHNILHFKQKSKILLKLKNYQHSLLKRITVKAYVPL